MRQNRTRKPEPAPLKRLLLVQIHGRPRHTGRKELLGHAAEAAQPADPGYEVDWAGRRIYSQGDADIPEGGVVQRPDGSRYIKGPLNVIFGYDSCPEDTDLSQPGNTPFTGDCVFCGDYGHDVYHCPILAAEQDPDAFCGD